MSPSSLVIIAVLSVELALPSFCIEAQDNLTSPVLNAQSKSQFACFSSSCAVDMRKNNSGQRFLRRRLKR